MKILIAGGSGFIGRIVTNLLREEGHDITILTRKEKEAEKNITYIQWLGKDTSPETEIKKADAVINLAGVSINAGRWTAKHQKQIYESRMIATEELLRIVAALPEKPAVFINASAIGIYPSSQQAVYTEKSVEVSDDFLGRTVNDWEQKAAKVSVHGIRPVFMRFGVVLGNEDGALPLMAMPYKWFVGGRVGSGKQWVSWVHVKDAARAILFAITNHHLNGPVNVTAPDPKQMEEFGRTIGFVLHRPHWFPAPSMIMKLALGKKSSLVLEGQQVVPEVLMREGFEFEFPTLKTALNDLLARKSGS
ncbi:TIGR01777 family oxidoreductase [Neobacillus vireti]|uniref:TIGR01777 family oxidoreductase n=1 Tax=Neobacillus vireti TaxID=220686 RepID=UPI002FFF9D59